MGKNKDFYLQYDKAKKVLCGDIARESIELAENQYLMGIMPEDEEPDKANFDVSLFKNNDGGWVVVLSDNTNINFDSYEEAEKYADKAAELHENNKKP